MDIQGELDITLSLSSDRTFQPQKSECQIESTRPLKATKIFTGKTIEYTLNTLPIIFSICSKAQSVTAIRAIESATNKPVSTKIESNREALVALESLREQCLRIFMDWPSHINEEVDNAHLAQVAMGINRLIKSLEPKATLAFPAKDFSLSANHLQAWNNFSEELSKTLFSTSVDQWIDDFLATSNTSSDSFLQRWSEKQTSQASRFIYWLTQQEWKYGGSSSIHHLPEIDDHDLLNKLTSDKESFTALPDWNEHCYELSWFSRLQNSPFNTISQLSNQLVAQHGNGILIRLIGRLLEVASLLKQLDGYFSKECLLKAPVCTEKGLAHSNAARGKLSHYVEVDGSKINRLIILAPTEWNFHPKGIAADSLSHLRLDSVLGSVKENHNISQQAELMIHAIDPCVGYTLNINLNNRVVH